MTNQQIKTFLKEIKEKLPEWLKDKKADVTDILDEIESHIWEKASEIAQNDDPDERSIQQAIISMGTPADIAKDYKKRGTPKFFISEELFPLYIRTLTVAISVIAGIAILASIPWTGNFQFWKFLGNLWNAIFTTAVYVTFFVTLIFVGLSMEGFLPEDLGVKGDIKLTYEFKTGHKEKDKGKKSKFYTPGEWFFGAVFGFVFGAILILQPIPQMKELFGTEMLAWFRLLGFLSIAEGTLNLFHIVLQKSNITGHQFLKLLLIVVKILGIFLLLQLLDNPAIITIISIENGVVISRPLVGYYLSSEKTFRTIMIVLIVLSGLGILDEFYKMVSLRYKFNASQIEE